MNKNQNTKSLYVSPENFLRESIEGSQDFSLQRNGGGNNEGNNQEQRMAPVYKDFTVSTKLDANGENYVMVKQYVANGSKIFKRDSNGNVQFTFSSMSGNNVVEIISTMLMMSYAECYASGKNFTDATEIKLKDIKISNGSNGDVELSKWYVQNVHKTIALYEINGEQFTDYRKFYHKLIYLISPVIVSIDVAGGKDFGRGEVLNNGNKVNIRLYDNTKKCTMALSNIIIYASSNGYYQVVFRIDNALLGSTSVNESFNLEIKRTFSVPYSCLYEGVIEVEAPSLMEAERYVREKALPNSSFNSRFDSSYSIKGYEIQGTKTIGSENGVVSEASIVDNIRGVLDKGVENANKLTTSLQQRYRDYKRSNEVRPYERAIVLNTVRNKGGARSGFIRTISLNPTLLFNNIKENDELVLKTDLPQKVYQDFADVLFNSFATDPYNEPIEGIDPSEAMQFIEKIEVDNAGEHRNLSSFFTAVRNGSIKISIRPIGEEGEYIKYDLLVNDTPLHFIFTMADRGGENVNDKFRVSVKTYPTKSEGIANTLSFALQLEEIVE